MKRTLYQNIAVLDARNVTEETAQSIYGFKNVAMVIVSTKSQRALAGVSMKNVATMLALPDGARLVRINGEATLSGAMLNAADEADGAEKRPIALKVNGQLNVEPSIQPETIAQFVCGGCVNGQVVASESQMQALYATGLKINGQAETYPDGYERRSGGELLTVAEVQSWPEGARKYMTRRVRVESGALEVIRARGMKIVGKLIVDSEEAQLLREVYAGDTGACLFVPRGARAIVKSVKINRHNAVTMRGRIWVWGNVTIESDVTEAMLANLETLEVHGKLTVPASLIGVLMDRVNEDVQWVSYEGKLLRNDGDLTLDADALEAYEKVTLVNTGDVTIEADVSAETLREKITMVFNDGDITGDKKQLAALRACLAGGDGDWNERREAQPAEEAAENDLPEDVVEVGNCANLVIG